MPEDYREGFSSGNGSDSFAVPSANGSLQSDSSFPADAQASGLGVGPVSSSPLDASSPQNGLPPQGGQPDQAASGSLPSSGRWDDHPHPPLSRHVPPPQPPQKRFFPTWPWVILILGVLGIGSCNFSFISTFDSLLTSSRETLSTLSRPGTAVLDIQGEIFDTRWAVESLERFQKNDLIKAVVIRINSPGGAVSPCQELYRALNAFTKPKIVTMGSVAASGGLYIAMAGNHIMANPGTITGSIGVIMETIEVDQAMDKLGVKVQVVKSGEHKDIGSPFRSMRQEERDMLQKMVSEVYEQFLRDVVAGRPKLDEAQIRPLADGRIFSGEEALKLGLADSMGGYADALAMARELGGLSPDSPIIYENGLGGFFEQLFDSKLGFLNKVSSDLNVPSIKFLYRPGLF
ncbi:MAG: signal peptide peptidase SppA [Deltaproteobacteria bacterium]|jgi:protease-4|nr:signal peptide peptidase SppA [Deltaproteobacteria bacterium]